MKLQDFKLKMAGNHLKTDANSTSLTIMAGMDSIVCQVCFKSLMNVEYDALYLYFSNEDKTFSVQAERGKCK
jgi:hypothetical protein